MKGPTTLSGNKQSRQVNHPPAVIEAQETGALLATQYKPTPAQLKYVMLLAAIHDPEKARKKLRIRIETIGSWELSDGYRAWKDSVIAAETVRHVGEARQKLLDLVRLGDLSAIKTYLEAYDSDYKKAQRKTDAPQTSAGPVSYHQHLHMSAPDR
jgi:hypothetical protein